MTTIISIMPKRTDEHNIEPLFPAPQEGSFGFSLLRKGTDLQIRIRDIIDSAKEATPETEWSTHPDLVKFNRALGSTPRFIKACTALSIMGGVYLTGCFMQKTSPIISLVERAFNFLTTNRESQEAIGRVTEANSRLNSTLDALEQTISPEAEELLSMVELAHDISNSPLMDQEKKDALKAALNQLDEALSDSIPGKIEIIVNMVSEFLKRPETQRDINTIKDQEKLYRLAVIEHADNQAKLTALSACREQEEQTLAQEKQAFIEEEQDFAKTKQSLANTLQAYEACKETDKACQADLAALLVEEAEKE